MIRFTELFDTAYDYTSQYTVGCRHIYIYIYIYVETTTCRIVR
jgi:hypothetical protein